MGVLFADSSCRLGHRHRGLIFLDLSLIPSLLPVFLAPTLDLAPITLTVQPTGAYSASPKNNIMSLNYL
jgi:hypothetical protein